MTDDKYQDIKRDNVVPAEELEKRRRARDAAKALRGSILENIEEGIANER